MLCAPDLAADTSSVPESMSSISDRAVSKLLFIVVAITPVGPVFTQPLQYRPGGTRLCPLKRFSLYEYGFLVKDRCVFWTCRFLDSAQFVWDDGLAGVKWHRWIDRYALVADAADDQAAGHILHLASEHRPRAIT